MTSSFFRFTFGFLAFIVISLAITVTIDKYTSSIDSTDSTQTASVGSWVQDRQ